MCVSGLSRGGRLFCSRLLTVAVNSIGRLISQGQIVIFSLSFLCVLGVTCWGVVIPETASAILHSGVGCDRIIKWVRRLLKNNMHMLWVGYTTLVITISSLT